MDPGTAIEIIAAGGLGAPLGLWEYLIGQGVFGAISALFIYMWLRTLKEKREELAAKDEIIAEKDTAISKAQDDRVEDANAAFEHRLDLQGKSIESMNQVAQALLGLQHSFKALREWVKK